MVELVVVEVEMVVAVWKVLGEVEVVELVVVEMVVVDVDLVVALWMVLVEVEVVEIVKTVFAETGSAHQA